MKAEQMQKIGTMLLLVLLLVFIQSSGFFSSSDSKKEEKKNKAKSATFLDKAKGCFRAKDRKVSTNALYTIKGEDTEYQFTPNGQLYCIKNAVHKNSQGGLVQQFDGTKDCMGLRIPKPDGSFVNTADLPFCMEGQTKHSISFVYHSAREDEVKITYIVNGVLLDMQIKLGPSFDANKQTEFIWYHQPVNQEKHYDSAIGKSYVAYGGGEGAYAYNYKYDKQRPGWFSSEKPPSSYPLKGVRFVAFHAGGHFLLGFIAENINGAFGIDQELDEGQKKDAILKNMGLRASFSTKELQGQGKTMSFYAGENMPERLKKVDDHYGDIGFAQQYYFGFSIFGAINKFFFYPTLERLSHKTGNAIISLLILIVLISIIFAFFAYKGHIVAIKQRVLQPFVKDIKAKHPSNSKMLEGMLYKRAGVSPFFMLVPKLLMLFSWIAIYPLLVYPIFFRRKSFLGVIDDVSSYDDLISFPRVPLLGDHISCLGLIVVLLPFLFNYLQKKKSGEGVVENAMDAQPGGKGLRYLSPLMMLYFLNNRAAIIWIFRLFQLIIDKAQVLLFDLVLDKKQIERETLRKAEEEQEQQKGAAASRMQMRLGRRMQRKNKK